MTKYLRFMRHGQTELNVRNCWQGHTDAPLTELGRRQSAESGLHLRESGIQLDHVFCSPLGRARETLEIALPGIAERGYELVDGLMEMSFGSLDGTVNSDNVVGPYHDYFLQFGGESEEHAEKRICSTLEGLMLRDDVQSALVVSHGTMGRLFKNHWKGLSQVEDVAHLSNCCVVTYAFDERERTFSCVDIYQPSCATMPQNALNHKAGK